METHNKELDINTIKISKFKLYVTLTFGALLLAITVRYFIIPVGLYSPGLAGMINGITYTVWDILDVTGALTISADGVATLGSSISKEQFTISSYWLLYILANIPIIYLMLTWYSKRFFGLSIYVFLVNFTFTMILTYVPGFSTVSFLTSADNSESGITIMFMAIMAGLFYGISVGTIFNVGACTMGLDPIMRYLSREKNKKIGPLLFTVSITNSIVWIMVSYFITHPTIEGASNWESFLFNTIFSPMFIGSFLFVGTYAITTNIIYAIEKKLKVEITTSKVEEMSEHFNEIKFHRSHSISSVKGGFSKKDFGNVIIIINAEEVHDILEHVTQVDTKAFVIVTQLWNTYDVFDWRPITKEDKQHLENKKAKQSSKEKTKSSKEKTIKKNKTNSL